MTTANIPSQPTLAIILAGAALLPFVDASHARPKTSTATLAQALVRLPPGAERVTALEERKSSDAVMQIITLAGGGDEGRNFIAITVMRDGGKNKDAPEKPTERGIRNEIAAALPNMRMRILTQPRYNGFGPYGLAQSAGDGPRQCIYAWQWLDGEGALAQKLGGQAAWRARICHNRTSVEGITAALDRIDFGAAAPGPAPRASRARKPSNKPAPQPSLPAQGAGELNFNYLAPVPAGAPSAAIQKLDPSIPAEAYRGPTTR